MAFDVQFYLSGGGDNRSGERSLGGAPSKFNVSTALLNNLFNDVTPQEAADGLVDYRCIYIFNKHQQSVLKDVIVTVDQTGGGATITPGSVIENDVQKVVVAGIPDAGGYFILDTDFGAPFQVYADPDNVGAWADAFQAAIRMTPLCDSVTVTGSQTGDVYTFLVTFSEASGRRLMPLIKLVKNALKEGGGTPVQILKVTDGSPIRRVADLISRRTEEPAGLSYALTGIPMGTLLPGDGFYLWFQREVPAGTAALADDGFSVTLEATAE